MYECFNCETRSVVWDNDFDAQHVGYDCIGVVHCLHCTNCGAVIQYLVKDDEDDDEESEKGEE